MQGVLTCHADRKPAGQRSKLFGPGADSNPEFRFRTDENFDPTKAGYSSISFGGRFGRTARITVDGVDISDETVGTTTEDIPASGIDQFQLAQSSLDFVE